MLPVGWVLGATGLCWAPGAVLPAQSPASHFQGDSSFVVMTNFIVTPHQAQGYCAEVRPPTIPPSPRGESHMEGEVPRALEVKLGRLPAGAAVEGSQAEIDMESQAPFGPAGAALPAACQAGC